ncbi:unnamed protein product [Spirodela intermedia]|uniref:AIR12 DOMON domain-containing protein n=1 Tax=Spirodela intermedia TaxID=51605 RepID=A0A7I8J1U5_SPIIN|nr:unnamed protein product [Spirodela intermedia]CAA6664107.1 unnamed protein product [Spirodela intermedia]
MARRLKMFSLFPLLIVVLLLKGVTVGRAQSGCAARTFAGNRKYGLCSELPRLGSTLHYTHDTGSSLLRLAFSATPSASGGSYKVRKSKIDYEVSDLEAEYGSDGVMTIFATMKLPAGTTKVNQVWQVGPSVRRQPHEALIRSGELGSQSHPGFSRRRRLFRWYHQLEASQGKCENATTPTPSHCA